MNICFYQKNMTSKEENYHKESLIDAGIKSIFRHLYHFHFSSISSKFNCSTISSLQAPSVFAIN